LELSIVIVNYNVEYFLEQCLYSVEKAIKNIKAEVWVVDNNSVDGSMKMVKEKFPWAKRIENKDNKGFSKANNQAIELSSGKFVLLLNPDTLVQEDTFTSIIEYLNLEENKNVGGLGVKMIDGSGNFLPESKRGLPTPEVAFYKIFGLSTIFKNSKRFGKYHLSYLNKDETNDIEILSGAFMFMRKEALDKVGLLDETFFMYGEDIDLSYRILKGGYRNVYFPKTRIIHYKGESTKKSSVNYVFVFYNAMIIFAEKHFSGQNAKLFSFLINLAIYFRASISILHRFVKRSIIPFVDASLIFTGLILIKNYWESVVRADVNLQFKEELIFIFFPAYTLIWLLSIYFSGGYDKPVKLSKIIKGVVAGSAVILIFYSLLSEEYRFSRALILLGTIWTAFSLPFLRIIYHHLKISNFSLEEDDKKRVLIIADKTESNRINQLMQQTQLASSFAAFINPDEESSEEDGFFIGNISRLKNIIEVYKINEIIFSGKNVAAQGIISTMALLENQSVNFKIVPPESMFIIGSNSINSNGDLYTIDINSITKNANKRNKRTFDFSASLLLFVSFPILIFLVKNPFKLLKNIFKVILGKLSIVGFTSVLTTKELEHLPKIKKGILSPLDIIPKNLHKDTNILKINQLYAKDYQVKNDFTILLKGLKKLDH
jgi:O-antigen biosynthesis protein